jgi:phage terminase small subunit
MLHMMTDKQTAFIKEFALTGNATQSAIKAGYSEKTSTQKGHQLRWQFQHQIEDETRRLMQAAVASKTLLSKNRPTNYGRNSLN